MTFIRHSVGKVGINKFMVTIDSKKILTSHPFSRLLPIAFLLHQQGRKLGGGSERFDNIEFFSSDKNVPHK